MATSLSTPIPSEIRRVVQVCWVVDDIDALHDTDRRVLVWESLRTLRDRGITVIAAASTPVELTRLGWDVAPTHIALPD